MQLNAWQFQGTHGEFDAKRWREGGVLRAASVAVAVVSAGVYSQVSWPWNNVRNPNNSFAAVSKAGANVNKKLVRTSED